MSEETPRRQYGEKAEKQDEKDEKGRNEKNYEEKWRRDPLNAAVWALILIWLGLALLASNIGLSFISIDLAWPVFFLGAGGILLLEVVFRLAVPAYRAPVGGTLILALVFLAIGLGGITENWNVVWPLVLIALGAFLLFRGIFRRRE